LILPSEPTLEVSPKSPEVITPEPQNDLDELELIEKADTPVSQEEVPEEISDRLDVEIAEEDILQATDDSAIQSPVDLAVSFLLNLTQVGIFVSLFISNGRSRIFN